MKLYRITLVRRDERNPVFRKEREHARLTAAVGCVDHRAARIDLIEINPQADEVVDMLNGAYEFARNVSAQRTWGIDSAGALVELSPGA